MIIFKTKNLDQRFYTKAIKRIFDAYNKRGSYRNFIKKWDINLKRLEDANKLFYDHVDLETGQKISNGIPSGVVGLNAITVYLHDVKLGSRKNLENLKVIGHEMAHVMLMIYTETDFVNIVHRINQIFLVKFWYYKRWWQFTYITLIDVRGWI